MEPKALDRDRPLWEQQADESQTAYAKFLTYRDMPRRSLADPELGSNAKELSRRWRWAERVLEWDRWLARQDAEALVRERIQMNQRHRAIGRTAQQKFVSWLQGMDPSKLKPSEAVRLAELAIRVEREATGANLPADQMPPEQPREVDDPFEGMTLAEIVGAKDDEDAKARVRAIFNGEGRL